MFGWFRNKKEDPRAQLEAILGDARLPSFPAIVVEALSLLRDPDASLHQVGDRLATDPGISARLLRLGNSAAMRRRHPVRNVHHAVSLLGRVNVESLLLSAGVAAAIGDPPDGFDVSEFWLGAARRAAAARAFAGRLHPATRSASFTAALLSDMAVPVLAHARGESYLKLVEASHEDGAALHTLERSELGWDHGFVAGALCRTWEFPALLTDAIGSHHEETSSEDVPPAVGIVAPLGTGDEGVDEVVETASERFGLPTDEIVQVLAEASEEAKEIAGAFGR